MKAEIKKEECIGCGACQMIAPEVFELGDDGLSQVIAESVDKDLEDKVREAIDACPTSAISMEEEKQED